MLERKSEYGIIGNPLGHSLSPLMHNAAFQHLQVEAVYNLFSLEEAELDSFFKQLRRPSSPIFGFNVTVPYKEKVLSFMDSLAPLAKKIGAVNTVVISPDRKRTGYNTDAPGFLAHLDELRWMTQNKRIAVLGAGGSARAIVTPLCLLPQRPKSIRIYNRHEGRLLSLLEDLSQRVDIGIVKGVKSVDDLDLKNCDMLINTTPIGLREDDPLLVEEDLLHPGLWVYDLIYNPKETLLLKMANQQGARTANGLGMLYYQGVLAFQHWVNIQLNDKVKKVMRQALEKGVLKNE